MRRSLTQINVQSDEGVIRSPFVNLTRRSQSF